jgi:cyanophycinase
MADSAFVSTDTDYDKVRSASLIFLTGGDQNRFLEKVDTTLRQAIKDAYFRGATVAGTSAGAALMSKIMITGDQHHEPEYEETYSRLFYKNGEYAEGLGLIENAVIDQHFITRSRYNRLISALADTSVPEAFGIEESTALLITPQYSTVVGDNQVVRLQKPDSFTERNGRIGFGEMKINMYLEGDTFSINPTK